MELYTYACSDGNGNNRVQGFGIQSENNETVMAMATNGVEGFIRKLYTNDVD